ncbi:MAG: aldo/keto reductase [Polyangiaceae bacterium]|jgi:aryl-alcohol dehydrogenase-like predicted oxidoreductase
MNRRILGRTGFSVSEVSFGAWAIGGAWGNVDDSESLRALRAAIDAGMNFIDTADVYGDGRSERLIARLRKESREPFYVATKAGRRLQPHTADRYNLANLRSHVERSLRNLDVEALDLLQLHCPPPEVFGRPEVFGALDELVREGKVRFYGVSVETVSEGKAALRFPNIQSIQIIFNMFRPKPAAELFAEAASAKVGILARVPLASGLLSGKFRADTRFDEGDHRNFNRHGQAFDVGETFSGVPYEIGLHAVDDLRPLVPVGATLAQFALRWILMSPAVTCAIPGAKSAAQARDNAAAASLPPIDPVAMARVQDVYDRHIRLHVHSHW